VLAITAGRQSPPNTKCPSSSAPWQFSSTTGLSLWLAGQGACSFGSVSGRFAGGNVFTRCAAGCSPRRWRISPRLRPVLAALHATPGRRACSGRGAPACNGRFGAGGGRSSHRSFSGRCSSHCLLGSTPGSHRRLLPNPSLVGTATGKALGPRTGQCHHPSRGPSAFPASAPQLKR